mgnify:CR=1 FL=1
MYLGREFACLNFLLRKVKNISILITQKVVFQDSFNKERRK